MLQTVGRAGQVLDLFSADAPEWGGKAVAHELDVAKSQAHELLVSLADIGLLQRRGPGRYRLGWRIVALNSLVVDTSDLGDESVRVLRALAAETGESVHLAAWGPGTAICVASFAGRDAFGPPPCAVGAGLPGHSVAAGKVLLAAQPWDAVAETVERDGLPRHTERTIGTPEQLRAELANVRRRGFACEEQEHDLAVCAVAAPVRDLDGRVVAAIGLSLATTRWPRSARDQTRAVAAAAARCSELLRRRTLHDGRFGIAERAVDAASGPVA
jgi:DNA-binding IclR family transcriptional regulator